MLLVTTALSGLMAGVIQTAPPQQAPQPQPAPAASQETPPPAAEPEPETTATTPVADDDSYDLGTVAVTGTRQRGSVDTDIPPDVTLTADEIMAYGASDIAELMTYLEPVTRSSSGRTDLQPVFLVNGRRISGFREIRGIPTEAIERTEILPEAVAVQFGYRPEQRVVNFVLKSDFRSTTYEATGRIPTEGGRTTVEAETDLLRIAGANRWSMDLEYERSTPLYETERDIRRDPGATPYDLVGNVTSNSYSPGCLTATPPTCTAIDPALGVAITPVPGATTTPTLADFVAAAGDPRSADLTAYRTLLSASERAQVSGTIKRDLNSTTQATISTSLEDTSSRSFNGLPGVRLALPETNPFSPFSDDVQVFRYLDDAAALQRETDRLQGELGFVLDGFIGEEWRWTATGEYTRTETDTVTGRGYNAEPFQDRLTAGDPTANPFGALDPAAFARVANDTARSVSQRLDTELVLTGDIWELPAGDVSSTFKVGADTLSLDSTSTRGGVTTERGQSRDRLSGQSSLNFPIASRRNEVLTGLGDLSVSVDAGFEDLSDFGGLSTFGTTVNWSPIEKLSFLASWTDEEGAPTISQLNDPLIATPNVPVFDFRTGETVLVTQFTGGNPNLDSDNRQVVRLGGTLRPLTDTDLSLSTTWTWSRTDDYIAAFPTLTPDLEAALPDRFVRDAVGNLVSVDARPLNFDRYERQDLRTGFNFSRAFGTPTPRPEGEGAAGPGRRGPGGTGGGAVVMRGGGGGGGGHQVRMGGGRGGGMQPGQGRFHVSVYHTWRLQDEIVIADGLPVLDLLDGAATSSRGGSPRHEIQAMGGVFRNGIGTFVMANWRDGTRIDGGTGPDLRFSDQLTVNLNVFMDLNQRTAWVERFPWLEGSRIQFGIQNLFDSRPEVTADGAETPLNYQPDFLDPEGRSVRLTLRKILF
ncbi:TonB-dependent receptor [Brevundimonas sp.]|uniref:TonB-dependent receptor n=1 Tax=Brevundimonas sp. TaxID=1871086 RepID=UPI0035AF6D27